METLHSRVAGLDVHKNTVVVCLRIAGSPAQTRTFGTMTDDLLALFDWLTVNKVTHVGMESTGVLWKPVWNVLEGGSWKMLLVNPRDVKQVPGRKSTSMTPSGLPSCWLADCSTAATCLSRDSGNCGI